MKTTKSIKASFENKLQDALSEKNLSEFLKISTKATPDEIRENEEEMFEEEKILEDVTD